MGTRANVRYDREERINDRSSPFRRKNMAPKTETRLVSMWRAEQEKEQHDIQRLLITA